MHNNTNIIIKIIIKQKSQYCENSSLYTRRRASPNSSSVGDRNGDKISDKKDSLVC